MTFNYASGDDVVPVQGTIVGRGDDHDHVEQPEPYGTGDVTNICTGNARVGVQARDVTTGNLTIRM